MPIGVRKYNLGPDNGSLLVRTKKAGAASKAGHDLLIEVTAWSATLEIGEDPARTRIELTADPGSLNVLEGSGGIQSLGEEDKASIKQTIDDDVLGGAAIEFHSIDVEVGSGGERLSVNGELELAGKRHAIGFELIADAEGRLTGSATVKQTEWGIKPYSALFGTLKVVDEVTVEVAAELSTD